MTYASRRGLIQPRSCGPDRADVAMRRKTHLASVITANVVRAGARGHCFNTVDLVNRLEEENRLGKAGTLATQLSRLEVVVLDELGYLPFARSGGQLLFHLSASSTRAPPSSSRPTSPLANGRPSSATPR